MTIAAKPAVTFTACFDTITTVNAKPIKLKGGIPLGGTYSGPGVNAGIFYPAIAGPGTHIITYTYTNAASCTASGLLSLVTVSSSPFACGSWLLDIRDNKSYPTVQIGTQCWMAYNLNYGSQIAGSLDRSSDQLPAARSQLPMGRTRPVRPIRFRPGPLSSRLACTIRDRLEHPICLLHQQRFRRKSIKILGIFRIQCIDHRGKIIQ
jgi:hypothetical protein